MHEVATMQDWSMRLTHLIDHAAREHGEREIVSAWADGRLTRSNWREVAHRSRQLAAALTRLGIGAGDRVATLAMNHANHLVAWYGTVGMGGVLHTINPRLFPEQIAFIANHAEDRVLLYDRMMAPLVDALRPQLSRVEHFICFDSAEVGDHGGFDAWIAREDGRFDWVDGDERDPCGLCYTSGTTGDPKGVLYTHRSSMIHAFAEVAPDCFGIGARSVALPIVPMFHANAWGLPWASAMAGCKLVLVADYRPELLLRLFRDEVVTHSAGVPTVWLSIIARVEETGEGLGPLERVTIGGSAAPRMMVEWLRARGVDVTHAWGMTETSPIGSIGAPPPGWESMSDSEQVDYVCRQGRVPFGIELAIVDDEGVPQPRDGESSGRLMVRGPWVVRRYFRHETDAIDADGWFDTGDVAVIHPDNTMQITDRTKDIIKSGGEWISSIELENAAMSYPGVAEAAAIGIAHPRWTERPILCVVRAAGADVCRDGLRAHLAARVAKWWLPDAVEFVDDLPHTATGKLNKRVLRQSFADYRLDAADEAAD